MAVEASIARYVPDDSPRFCEINSQDMKTPGFVFTPPGGIPTRTLECKKLRRVLRNPQFFSTPDEQRAGLTIGVTCTRIAQKDYRLGDTKVRNSLSDADLKPKERAEWLTSNARSNRKDGPELPVLYLKELRPCPAVHPQSRTREIRRIESRIKTNQTVI